MRTSTSRAVLAAFTLSAVGVLPGFFSSQARGQVVNVLGDLGAGSFSGVSVTVPGATSTLPVSMTGTNGTLTADVIVANNATGNVFDLTITNLTYTCTVPNSSGFGDVAMIVNHTYQVGAGPGPYQGSHALSGNMSAGPLSVVLLDSIQDVGGANVALATMIATTPVFALGPVSSSLPVPSSNLYSIQATLRLRTDGTGFINLPTSAHVQFAPVGIPEPTTMLLAGLPMALTSRSLRRRKR
jgi:hypothetical protein